VWKGRIILSVMKITVFSLELFSGEDTYVGRPPISSSIPTGLPSLKAPEIQQEDTPTPVDIVEGFSRFGGKWI
jgi:hypothetical protein